MKQSLQSCEDHSKTIRKTMARAKSVVTIDWQWLQQTTRLLSSTLTGFSSSIAKPCFTRKFTSKTKSATFWQMVTKRKSGVSTHLFYLHKSRKRKFSFSGRALTWMQIRVLIKERLKCNKFANKHCTSFTRTVLTRMWPIRTKAKITCQLVCSLL